jgi:hypothetical protein
MGIATSIWNGWEILYFNPIREFVTKENLAIQCVVIGSSKKNT